MSFAHVKLVNNHFGLQPRKSKDEMVGQIVYQVGTSLKVLVSAQGPFPLKHWNEIVEEFGGAPRNSFESVASEIEFALDPVFDELDGDTTIATLRQNKPETRVLARKLGCEPTELDLVLGETHGGTLLATFVTRFREAQASMPRQTPGQHGLPGVASTRVNAASVEHMSLAWIGSQVLTADELSIAAGFYDVKFIERVLRSSQARQVRLMFNGLGGRRLSEQCSELKELAKNLNKGQRTVDVRLAFAPGLFHSKLFLVSQGGSTRALVGSANATLAAFTQNEELMVTLPEAGSLVGYFDAAWADASPLGALQEQVNSLINFFRTGVLYFKPVATLATSVNPFRDLLKLMTNEERAALGGVQLPYADQATGIGPFNLKHAVQGITNDDPWDDLEDEMANHDDNRAPRLSIRHWSVETCFGYWVPNALDRDWRGRLEDAGSMKRARLERFRAELVNLDKDVLLEKYREYLDEVRSLLTARIPRFASLCNRLERDPFNEAYFEKFATRVIGYLEDKTRLKRLAEPFISGGMPEIWEDVQAYQDFRTSFFDYLDRAARLPSSKPRVARIILERLGVDAPLDGEEEWSEVLGEFLGEYGWNDDDWTAHA
jgi:hypothetical protein